MKNRLLLVTLAVFAVGLAVACGEGSNTLITTVSEILPAGWTISAATNAVPYNLSIQPGRPTGTSLTFVGSVTVRGPRGINPQKESFIVWIMPQDYVPTKPETIAQFVAARLLGTNNSMAVYWTTFTSGTPSWENWKDDLTQKLGINITAAQQPGAGYPPQGVGSPDP